MPPILTVKNLAVSFGDFKVIKDLSFSVEQGQTLAIVGPNGAGKSVLFRALLDLVPYTGNIAWQDGVKIGYVPQKLTIERELPLTVGEFLQFKIAHKSKDKIFQAVRAVDHSAHDEYHIQNHLLNKKLGVLSGGELQKMLIAWAIIDEPNVLLFDEPTAGVDIGGEETIYATLNHLKKEKNLTILLISHDMYVVYHYADQVLCLNKELLCFGTPQTALTSEILKQMYGKGAKAYLHEHTT